MGEGTTLQTILMTAAGGIWGACLAAGSWWILIHSVSGMLRRAHTTAPKHRYAMGLLLGVGLGRWLLYAGWLYVGLAILRFDGIALAVGFFLCWSAGLILWTRQSLKTPCSFQPTPPNPSKLPSEV